MSVVGRQSIPPPVATGGDHQLILLATNRALVSQGASAVSLDPGGSPGNLGVEHVLNPHLDLAWRSSSIAALAGAGHEILTLRIFLGSPRRIDAGTLHKHNIRAATRWRFYSSTVGSPSEKPLWEGDWTDPIVRARLEDFAKYSPGGGGMPSYSLGPDEEDVDLWAQTFALDTPIFADQPYDGVRTVEVDFDLTRLDGNGGVDYFQVGFLGCWLAFRPRYNYRTGQGKFTPIDDSIVTRLPETGAALGRERSRRLAFDFSLEHLDREQALRQILTKMTQRNSRLTRVFAWAEPNQRQYFYDQRVLGTLIKPPAIVHARQDPAVAYSANAFRIEGTE